MPNTHIFLDNANIYGGAQQAAKEFEGVPWQSVRVEYASLLRLLTWGKNQRKTSMLAGSVPPGNEALWQAARDAGFDTTLLRRVENDDGRLVEQAVDEAIHLKIANILLDEEEPGIIVLATGDGRATPQGCSFTQQVVRAAKRGWRVEIWSWRSQLSKYLRDTRTRYPDLISVYKFDEWYREIVFIKGGTYPVGSSTLEYNSRRVESLNLTDSRFLEGKLG